MVFQMCRELPLTRCFRVFIDNHFTTESLFLALLSIGLDAVGTVRKIRLPDIPTHGPRASPTAWNTSSRLGFGTTDHRVHYILWNDKTVVYFLSTFHTATDRTPKLRNLPAQPTPECSAYFAQHHIPSNPGQAIVPTPTVGMEYNAYMGGVDTADQYRSYYSVQRRETRNWMPLFAWLLDTTIINSYIISNTLQCSIKGQREFRHHLALELFNQAVPAVPGAHDEFEIPDLSPLLNLPRQRRFADITNNTLR